MYGQGNTVKKRQRLPALAALCLSAFSYLNDFGEVRIVILDGVFHLECKWLGNGIGIGDLRLLKRCMTSWFCLHIFFL